MLQEIDINGIHVAEAEALYDKHESQLEAYIDHLLEWNVKINLVSRMVSRETVREHVVHSLVPAAMGLLDNTGVWVDAGTGGGLPGIPLSIVMPDKKWILNDNIRKKMTAVSAITDDLGLANVVVEAQSISLVRMPTGAGIVSKHAFKIPHLLRLLKGKPWKEIIMWKGVEGVEEEFSQAGKGLRATMFVFNTEDSFYEGKAIVKLTKTKRLT